MRKGEHIKILFLTNSSAIYFLNLLVYYGFEIIYLFKVSKIPLKMSNKSKNLLLFLFCHNCVIIIYFLTKYNLQVVNIVLIPKQEMMKNNI